jgi:hypothetical protein
MQDDKKYLSELRGHVYQRMILKEAGWVDWIERLTGKKGV